MQAGNLDYRDGTLTIDGGAFQHGSNGYTLQGANSSSHTLLTMENGGTWDVGGNLNVASSQDGTLNILSGSVVTNAKGAIGANSGAVGIATVSGPGSIWTSSDSLSVGGSNTNAGGTGTLTITNGGTVEVANALNIWNAGTVELNGGTLKVGSLDPSIGTFNWVEGTLDVGTYVGNLTQNHSTLSAELIQGNLTQNGGTLAAGNSPGITVITGDYSLNSGGTLEIELAGPDGVPGVDFDYYDVSGGGQSAWPA